MSKKPEIKKILRLSENKFPVVGVGASAGGFIAFQKLLKAIPENSGMAFVLVQHLDPNRESLLPELLQKSTSLPIVEISDEITVKPNTIYIIPSNKMLLSNDGSLELHERSLETGFQLIDVFFTSLAVVHQSHSIGVVLSGTGSDGTEGLRSIRQQGGISIVQSLESSEFTGMPENAINSGVVDLVLSPEKIPQKILQILKKNSGKKNESDQLYHDDPVSKKKIFALLRNKKGSDFTYYKENTTSRRILRRMGLNNKEQLADYLALLKSKPSELDMLYQDLLIPVTNFFRDAPVFDDLCHTLFPHIIETKKEDDAIRMWVAGCSTGQEVYTIAICLLEYLDGKDNGKIQIFGTDVSEPAITKARNGIYKSTEVDGISQKRLDRFFTKIDGHYQINKPVRDICVFAIHNFLQDPPFGKIDFISCRNVLIYLQPYLQKKALTAFHYSLVPKGYLLLGKSETIGHVSDLFINAQKHQKLFVRKDGQIVHRPIPIHRNEQNSKHLNTNFKPEHMRTDFQKVADDIILNEYSPCGVVVNDSFDIVHFRGKTAHFLEQSTGKPTHNLMKMAKAGFAFELRNILHKVKKEQNKFEEASRIIKEDIPLEINGEEHAVSIEAVSLPKLIEPHYLILFHDNGPTTYKNISPSSKENEKDRYIKKLREELLQTREDMRSITEEQETVNDDLQSANEELQSSSEELQSLNEELETSQEELQVTNEELSSVNQELTILNSEFAKTKKYAEAIIDTIREPLLILDNTLKIKSANKAFYRVFNVHEQDIVKESVFNTGNGQWNITELRTLLTDVLLKNKSFEDFELIHDFPKLGKRTLILNARQIVSTLENENLVLLAIEDVTDWEITEKKNILSAIVESSEDAIISKKLDGTITSWNQGAQKIFGYEAEEVIGENIRLIIPSDRQQEEDIIIGKIKKGEILDHFETERVGKNGKLISLSLTVSPLKNSSGKIIGASKIARDISKQLQVARELEISEHRYREVIHSSPSLIATFRGENLIIEIANDAIIEAWGKGKDIIGKPFFEVMPELVEQGFDKMFSDVYETGIPFEAYEMPVTMIRNGKKELGYYNFIYYPEKDIDGKIIGVVDIATEVTPQAIVNNKIRQSEEKFRQIANLVPDKIINADAEGNVYYYNKSWETFSGYSTETLKKEGWQIVMHPNELEEINKHWKNAVDTGSDFEMELRCRDKNGDYKWHLARTLPIKDENGKISMWIGTTTEIQHLKEEQKRKEDFLKMVSHELKTPVTSIKGYVQLLLNLCKPENRDKLEKFPLVSSLERIDVQVTRLTRLIYEMLDLSRLEDQTLEFHKKSFSLNKLVKHTVEDIERTNTQYKIDVFHMADCEVVGDEERIAQVLINFITNAIKYSPSNQNIGVTVHKVENGDLAVSVKDYGIGIDKKDQQKIFERFYRVDGENQETYSGFGIGLYLCNEIIKRHHGNIIVESKKGEGSVFTFTLPCEG